MRISCFKLLYWLQNHVTMLPTQRIFMCTQTLILLGVTTSALKNADFIP